MSLGSVVFVAHHWWAKFSTLFGGGLRTQDAIFVMHNMATFTYLDDAATVREIGIMVRMV